MPPTLAVSDHNEPSFGQRLVGAVLDLASLTVIALLVGVLGLPERVTYLILLVVSWLYYAVVPISRGQTIGKRMVGTRLVVADMEESFPSLYVTTVRWVALFGPLWMSRIIEIDDIYIALYTLAVVLPILYGPHHLGLHDRITRTIVVVAPDQR